MSSRSIQLQRVSELAAFAGAISKTYSNTDVRDHFLYLVKHSAKLPCVVCLIVTAIVIAAPGVRLGVPGEWEWNRHELLESASGIEKGNVSVSNVLLEIVDRFLPSLLVAAMLGWLCLKGSQWIDKVSRPKVAALYCGLLFVNWFWLGTIQRTAPATHHATKPLWVLYDQSSSGYFYEAVFHINSTGEFLRGYEQRMKEGEVLHVGTHPPGLFLLSRACLHACESSPTLVSVVESLTAQNHREAFRVIESAAGSQTPLSHAAFAALQLLSLITRLAVVLTTIPLVILTQVFFNRSTAWKVACLWCTLPCLAIFLPKSDLLFPLTSTLVLSLMVLSTRGWRSVPWAVAGGVVLFCGLILSLAHLPVVVLVCLFAGTRAVQFRSRTLLLDSVSVGLMLATVGILTLTFGWLTDCNLFQVWKLNLTNHEGFYSQFSRTWWKWLLVNPLELAFSVGMPLAALAAVGGRNAIRTILQQGNGATSVRPDAITFCVAAIATWGLLWLSGKNQGEAARLWCFLTPWLLIVAGSVLHNSIDEKLAPNRFRWLLFTQLVVCVITVSRVSGFSF